MKTSEPGREEIIDRFLFPHFYFKIKLLGLRPYLHCTDQFASTLCLYPSRTLSPFIAAFGKNNTKMHYQPVAEIDAADEVGPLNVALRHSAG